MFTAEFVADLRNKPAGVPHIPEFMGAVQRGCTEDNVIMNALLETENAVLIEASPYDGIYGAGLAESDLLNSDGSLKVQPENWKNPKNGTQATNHLGFVLMGIRDLFRQLMGHSWRPGEEYKSL